MRKTVGFVLVASLFLLIGVATAQVAVVKRDLAAEKVYWGPEDYRDARPMPMPRVVNFEALSPEDFAKTQTFDPEAEKLFGREPAAVPPMVRGKARLSFYTKLFDFDPKSLRELAPVEPDDGAEQKNRGTINLDFSSSRLVPTSAAQVFPYSAVGKLFFSGPGGNFVCSGAVIARRLVLTAGHCVHGGPGQGFFNNFRFSPAFTNGAAPFGQWAASEVFVSSVWSDSGRVPNAEDWGILVMQDQGGQAIAEVTGRLSFKTNRLVTNHVKMLGYPAAFDGGQEMHQVDSSSLLLAQSSTVVYGGDMTGGSSGGPWVHNFGIKAVGQTEGRNRSINRVVGVTSYIFGDSRVLIIGSSELNTNFRRLRKDACNDQPGNC